MDHLLHARPGEAAEVFHAAAEKCRAAGRPGSDVAKALINAAAAELAMELHRRCIKVWTGQIRDLGTGT